MKVQWDQDDSGGSYGIGNNNNLVGYKMEEEEMH